MNKLDKMQLELISQFSKRVTVPLLYELSETSVDMIGTGFFVEFGQKLFLVTASHTFDPPRVIENILFPMLGVSELNGIGKFILHRSPQRDLDIALMELRDAPTIQKVKDSWTILKRSQIAMPSHEVGGSFILNGYPSMYGTVRNGSVVSGNLITLLTERIEPPNDVTSPVMSGLDMFFRYDAEGITHSGDTIVSPRLPGCSGGPIWEYQDSAGPWTAESCLKLVGIDISYQSGRWFRGQSSQLLLEVLTRITSSA